jgi:hypothetical protein
LSRSRTACSIASGVCSAADRGAASPVPPEDGFTVAYGTWIDASSSDGPRIVPIAIVEKDDGSTVTFFPMRPGSPHGNLNGAATQARQV